MRIFFIQLLSPCLHFINNNLTIPTHIEETLEQLIILNPHNNLNFSSNNPYFFNIPTKNITDKFTMIRDLCQFFQPAFISYFNLLSFPTNWIIVLNDWKRKIRKETSQKFPFKIFFFKSSVTRKIKDLQHFTS